MAHRKYIKRGNKVFGPYLYENYRENGITKTRYLGKAKKKKKSLQVNKRIFLIFGIVIILGLLIFGGFLVRDNLPEEGFEELPSIKGILNLFLFKNLEFFSASVEIVQNDPPEILNLVEEVFVCENRALSGINFTAIDPQGDPLSFYINPPYGLFRVRPESSPRGESLTGVEVEIYTWRVFLKNDVNRQRIPGQSHAIYEEIVTAADSTFTDNEKINITVIEVNNLEMENIGVQTVWTHGDNTTFYHRVDVYDPENMDLSFNISFEPNDNLFNISDNGEMNFTANESYLPVGENSTTYNVTVCANDSGLEFPPHPRITDCWAYALYADPLTVCDEFQLTITKENRPPVITSYNPGNLSFRAGGTQLLYFNMTGYDPDHTIPDVYWHVDGVFKKYTENSTFDEFNYRFGCGVGGEHIVKLEITDGELNDSIQWNITVDYVSCGDGGGGRGGGGRIFCIPEWSCDVWNQCQNLKDAYDLGSINYFFYNLTKSRCDKFGYDEETCGFQIRECVDLNKCGYNNTKFPTLQECYYTEFPNCEDGIKNCHNGSCEILVDCGGPCLPCGTCDDGIQSQGEEGIDCGGPCPPCEEFPFGPLLFKLIITYSLIILLLIIFIFVIYQVRKYLKSRGEVKEKGIEKKFSGRTVAVIISILVVLFLANIFAVNIAYSDKIYLEVSEDEGALGSYGLFNNFLRNFANLFMINSVTVIIKTSGDTRLGVWDDTDDTTIEKYTECFEYCGQKNKDTGISHWNVYFYANYTENYIPITNSEGDCQIWFSGGWNNMNYNSTSTYWEYNRSFNYKGPNDFNISCTGDYNDLSIYTDSNISNTKPYIIQSAGGWILGSMNCTEDILCSYNFSQNVSEDDYNDLGSLVYGYISSSNTSLTDFTMDDVSGILEVNVSHSNNTGSKNVELSVWDREAPVASAVLSVFIQEINDPPYFVDLENQSFNMTQRFEYIIQIKDEENNIPFVLDINFTSCVPAAWSTRNGTSLNCELFDESNYTFDPNTGLLNISFIPSKNDVGVYTINFSVMDYNPDLGNATGSKTVNFTVEVINEPPFFTYVCDNERYAVEDVLFNCWINASDLEEEDNLTFISDTPWFLDKKTSPCDASTDFNSSVEVSFTPRDPEVGNWSINITVIDNGNPVMSNSTYIWFFVQNTNDSVVLDYIDDQVCYPANNYHIPVIAYDDDLLIPVTTQPEVYQEDIVFTLRYENGSDIPWIQVNEEGVSDNSSVAYLDFVPGANIGLHWVNLSVHDSNFYSSDSQIFLINVSGNFPPVWEEPLQTNFDLNEGDSFILDLSVNVTDADGDTIVFSSETEEIFPSFSITSGGIINFDVDDVDVGYHTVTITATDGKSPVPKNFTFTIHNINETPYIQNPLEAENMSSFFINRNSDIFTYEDNIVKISMFVEDDDFKIPQKDYYDEDLIIDLTIDGPNTTLFDFIVELPPFPLENISLYNASFIPRKSDVGEYNVTILATDISGLSDTFYFNMTILPIEHPPVLMNFTNYSAVVNETFYLNIESTDLEDINDSAGLLTYSYNFLNGTDFILGNENIFNTTSGELNYTFSDVGQYRINITVQDSGGFIDFGDFWLFVYDRPVINFPTPPCFYDLQENVTSGLLYRAYHFNEDNLSYHFYLGNGSKGNFSYYGNNTNLNWFFTPNFTDETYGGTENLTLIVSNPIFPNLNTSVTCQANITHSNAPVTFEGWIGDKSTTYNNQIAIDLKDFFNDVDHWDPYYNQTVSFIVSSYTNPSSIFSNISAALVINIFI